MEFFDRLHRFLRYLDERDLYRFIGALIGGILLIIGIFLYFYFSTVSDLQRRIKSLNQKRTEALAILSKYEIVVQQQKSVDEILKKDPNFIIKHFFNTTLQSLGLTQYLKKDPDVSSQNLVSGYRELRLEARLTGLSMKQVVELLDKIEQNERVYVKEITMHATKQRTLDTTLTIATFEAHATA